MSGRKPTVAPAAVVDIVLQFKERVIEIGENG